MTAYYPISAPSLSSTNVSGNWWLRSPCYSYYSHYQPFNIYSPSKDRPLPREEIHQISDEEFDAAFNDLLFGNE